MFTIGGVCQRLGVGNEVIARPFLAAVEVVSHEDTTLNAVPELLFFLMWPLGFVPDPCPKWDEVSSEGFPSSPLIWGEVVWARVREVMEAGKALPSFTPPLVSEAAGGGF